MKLLLLAVLVIAVAGCASTGAFPHASTTQVSLSQSNYLVVKSNAIGTSSGLKLLGLLPLASPRYTTAMSSLYNNASVKEGRAYALANVIQERSSTFFIFFTVPKLTVRADVIEFLDENEKVMWRKGNMK